MDDFGNSLDFYMYYFPNEKEKKNFNWTGYVYWFCPCEVSFNKGI